MNTEDAPLDDGQDEPRYQAVRSVALDRPGALETLLAALYDQSWRVRKVASERIAQLTDAAQAAARLVEVLGDRDATGARNAAAEALGRIGEPAIPALLALLEHDGADQRKFAAEILGGIGSRAAERALIAALEDVDPNVQVAAAEALGRVGAEEAASALEGVLERPDALLRLSVMEALAQLGRAPPLPVLVALLEEPKVRRAAYRSLGLVAHPSAVDLICRGIVHEVRAVREASFAALAVQRARAQAASRAEIDNKVRIALRRAPDVRSLLESALGGDDPRVRTGAVWAAAAYKDPGLAAALAEVAEDERLVQEVIPALLQLGAAAGPALLEVLPTLNGTARQAAGEALVQLATPSLAQRLGALLDSGEPDLELVAVRALGRCQSLDAAPLLLRALTAPSLAVASARALVALGQSFRGQVLENLRRVVRGQATPAAILALARVGEEASLPELRASIRDLDPSVRAATAEAASEIGGEGSLELARLALADEVPQVRAAAARGLGKLNDARAFMLLRLALADEDASVQAEAVEAAGDLGGTGLVPELRALAVSEDPHRAGRAIRTLSRLGAMDAQVLHAAARHADPEVVKEAVIAGAALEEGIAVAEAHLAHARWDVRVAAARALAAGGGRAQVAPLQNALEREEDVLARESLRGALEQLSRR